MSRLSPFRRAAWTLALAGTLLASPANAAKPQPASWSGPFWDQSETGIVEQQSPYPYWTLTPQSVLNPEMYFPGGCAWDVDDRQVALLNGSSIDPGASASVSMCIFADWGAHQFGLRLSPGLVGSISVDGFTLPVSSIGCIVGPQYRLVQKGTEAGPALDPGWAYSPLLSPVEGSNGGVARRTTVTFTVTNPTLRRIRSPQAEARLVLATWRPAAETTGCPFPWHSEFASFGSDPRYWYWPR